MITIASLAVSNKSKKITRILFASTIMVFYSFFSFQPLEQEEKNPYREVFCALIYLSRTGIENYNDVIHNISDFMINVAEPVIYKRKFIISNINGKEAEAFEAFSLLNYWFYRNRTVLQASCQELLSKEVPDNLLGVYSIISEFSKALDEITEYEHNYIYLRNIYVVMLDIILSSVDFIETNPAYFQGRKILDKLLTETKLLKSDIRSTPINNRNDILPLYLKMKEFFSIYILPW